MNTFESSFLGAMVGALGLCLLSTGCIIDTTNNDDDDDGQAGTTDDGGPPPTTGQPSDTTTGSSVDDTAGNDTVDGTTGGPAGECTENLVVDPGFEGGTPSEAWAESSDLFGTPICDASCTDEPGAAPYAGEWWAWFGGDADDPDAASVSQTITIPPDAAYLSFWFQIRSAAGTGDDLFTATLDGETVFMVTDLEMPEYDDYTRVQLDVSDWADGGTYELRFASVHAGTGLTSFYLDEVGLISCSEAVGTGSDTVGQDETAGTTEGTTGTGTGTGTDTGAESGSSGGSSGSSGG